MSDTAELFAALDGTWPAARRLVQGPFTLRDGAGGGKRASTATLDGAWSEDDITAACDGMRAMGQPALFQLRDDADDALDGALAGRGLGVVDPTQLRACDIGVLTQHDVPLVATFTIWEPLQIIRDIWAEGGIGPERIAVMERVSGAHTAILARTSGKPSGAAFVALNGTVAMVHALETRGVLRRNGAARNMMLTAAHWAAAQGAATMAVAVTEANEAANALYASLGMPVCGRYHYRIEESA